MLWKAWPPGEPSDFELEKLTRLYYVASTAGLQIPMSSAPLPTQQETNQVSYSGKCFSCAAYAESWAPAIQACHNKRDNTDSVAAEWFDMSFHSKYAFCKTLTSFSDFIHSKSRSFSQSSASCLQSASTPERTNQRSEIYLNRRTLGSIHRTTG